MNNDIAKAISISAIWISTSIVFAFGIFDFNWNGEIAILFMLVISLSIIFTASSSTKIILNSSSVNNKEQSSESGI